MRFNSGFKGLIPVGKEIFVFSETCRRSLCPTQTAIQWVPKYSHEGRAAGRWT